MVKYRLGEVQSPHLSKELALHRSIKAFVHLVHAKRNTTRNTSAQIARCMDTDTSESIILSWGEGEYRDHTLRVMAVLERLDRAH